MPSIRYNGHIIEARTTDHFVNATQMCKAVGKDLNEVLSNPKTQNFIRCFKEKTGIVSNEYLFDAVKPTKSNVGGLFVHKAIAHYIACRTSLDFYTTFLLATDTLFIDEDLKNLCELQQCVSKLYEDKSQVNRVVKQLEENIAHKEAYKEKQIALEDLLSCSPKDPAELIKKKFIRLLAAENNRAITSENLEATKAQKDKRSMDGTYKSFTTRIAKLKLMKKW